MKTRLLIAALLLSVSASACDICTIYIGINPNDFNNSVSVMYRSRLLQGTVYPRVAAPETMQLRHAAHIEVPTAQEAQELYNVYEIRARYFLNPKFHLMASVPVVHNIRTIGGVTQFDLTGPGDPLLLAQYQLFSSKGERDSSKMVHRLIGGAGVKLPLGKKRMTQNGKIADLDMQPSTGSFDFITRVEYTGLWKNIGLFAAASYKLNTRGSEEYRYGNTINANLNLFYQLRWGLKKMVVPHVGLYSESAARDYQYGIRENESGGTVLLGSAGFDLYLGRASFNLAFQPALGNYFTPTQLPVTNRWIAGVNWNF